MGKGLENVVHYSRNPPIKGLVANKMYPLYL